MRRAADARRCSQLRTEADGNRAGLCAAGRGRRPLVQVSGPDLAREVAASCSLAGSASTIRRWLACDALKPGQPPVLDLRPRTRRFAARDRPGGWICTPGSGRRPLGPPDDHVKNLRDEKTSSRPV